jgi:RNAse (barnase) inhibitor barstar
LAESYYSFRTLEFQEFQDKSKSYQERLKNFDIKTGKTEEIEALATDVTQFYRDHISYILRHSEHLLTPLKIILENAEKRINDKNPKRKRLNEIKEEIIKTQDSLEERISKMTFALENTKVSSMQGLSSILEDFDQALLDIKELEGKGETIRAELLSSWNS